MIINAITVRDLCVSYGNQIALSDINLEIPEGIYLSIFGPNGSGKSTFLKTLIGLNREFSGKIEIYGKPISKIDPSIIGYVPQIKTLDKSFPAKAIELVLSGINHTWSIKSNKEAKSKAYSMMESLNSLEFADKRLSELSGGQLQKVYLARSLVRSPKILLLDEPATGVDFVCETNLNKIIGDYTKSNTITVLMVTHDWTSAFHHSSHILFLNRHQIFYGDKADAFTDEHLKLTFSHFADKHNVSFIMQKQ